MSKNLRPTARKPAIKFPNLQKKMLLQSLHRKQPKKH